ncbi:MAG TPA: pyridoxamine 5'-phosphate oxidase family protein [Roseiflexaceae bacterium]|nr:pyridoxamine 5'-phosphate oxidase family protein [Roseiflexaceae bacterium]
MKHEDRVMVGGLLGGRRQAALGTLAEGAPFVSMVAYAPEPEFAGFLLHLSRLAPHTLHLLADPRASLLICEPDGPAVENVQTLARITLSGPAAQLPRDAPGYSAARARYLEHLPAAAMLFDFPDFDLYRLTPREARYIGGFARAFALTPQQLRECFAAAQPDRP